MFSCKVKFVVDHDHHAGYNVNNHLHPCYEIVFYRKGEGETTIDGRKYHFSDNTFSLIEPNLKHNENAIGPVDLFYVGFVIDDAFLSIRSGVYSDNAFHIKEEMEQILMEMKKQGPYYERMMDLLIEEVVLKISRGLYEEKNAKNDPFLQVKDFIHLNCMKRIGGSFIAKNFGFNPDYFRLAFKKRYGISLKTYMMNERIRYAIDLLENSEESIKDIAEMSGFSSSSHFVMAFKKSTGITPKQYREDSLKGNNHKEIALYE